MPTALPNCPATGLAGKTSHHHSGYWKLMVGSCCNLGRTSSLLGRRVRHVVCLATCFALDGHCGTGHCVNRSPRRKGDRLSSRLSIDEYPLAYVFLCGFVESTSTVVLGSRSGLLAACWRDGFP